MTCRKEMEEGGQVKLEIGSAGDWGGKRQGEEEQGKCTQEREND